LNHVIPISTRIDATTVPCPDFIGVEKNSFISIGTSLLHLAASSCSVHVNPRAEMIDSQR